jgi:hypothetical protein
LNSKKAFNLWIQGSERGLRQARGVSKRKHRKAIHWRRGSFGRVILIAHNFAIASSRTAKREWPRRAAAELSRLHFGTLSNPALSAKAAFCLIDGSRDPIARRRVDDHVQKRHGSLLSQSLKPSRLEYPSHKRVGGASRVPIYGAEFWTGTWRPNGDGKLVTAFGACIQPGVSRSTLKRRDFGPIGVDEYRTRRWANVGLRATSGPRRESSNRQHSWFPARNDLFLFHFIPVPFLSRAKTRRLRSG